MPVTAVTEDTSPRGGVTFALWEPPLLPPDTDNPADLTPTRRSALRETADLLADSVAAGVRTLAFVRSRRGAEVVATSARRSLDEAVPGLGGGSPRTGAATCPRSDGRWNGRCSTGSCSGWPRPTRWSSASTWSGWTRC